MKVNKAVAILTLCSLFFCACSQNTLDTNANGENTESIQAPKVTTDWHLRHLKCKSINPL